ncbi:flagellar biosynthesis anti-sigma factor FlgM [Bacillus sp. ISL-35]|uniref:flagellar biosynthesis anti-sigma factor FlgM n=1 Tax=Bacillus sp. ISL-35 TaxID=2819122 RepID=UPI001BE5F369|nr:flagellar biosynthesis anti-sigma factor FlgM [Bacillus sp. ISL-35]MBT2678855.1 flagellar biosynthesis anti-sigma factor FlgM [Bacillus sp. ISL-35]MBT2703847.1 flagellar biosynthesis anti-sigma factor FlgM [Chryseobacterium sp. ISL-80]
MKINNNFGPSGINPYKRQMNKLDAAAAAQNKKADKVEISSTAKEMQQLSQVSVERKQKVEELKIQVENGTYKLDSKETAKSIINFYRNK